MLCVMPDKQKAIRFLIITFLINYFIGGIYLFLHYKTGVFKQSQFIATAIAIVYMIIPGIASIVLIKFSFKEKLKDYGVTFKFNRWWLPAWILPYLITVLTVVVCVVLGWGYFDPTFADFLDQLRDKLPPEQFEKAQAQLANIPTALQ
jgi:ABC-type sugar transport system permease subunit